MSKTAVQVSNILREFDRKAVGCTNSAPFSFTDRDTPRGGTVNAKDSLGWRNEVYKVAQLQL